jgi:adenylyltransferase/sulfurtransferase
VDGSDNWETRYLINDFSIKEGIPWLFGSAIREEGLFMPILPDMLCLRCIFREPPIHAETCVSQGVLPSITSIVASVQVSWAINYIALKRTQGGFLLTIDLGDLNFKKLNLQKWDKCPVCVEKKFDYLTGKSFHQAEKLCGVDTVQILPKKRISLDSLFNRFDGKFPIRRTGHYLRIKFGDFEVTFFSDGRALIRKPGITVEEAKRVYGEIVG